MASSKWACGYPTLESERILRRRLQNGERLFAFFGSELAIGGARRLRRATENGYRFPTLASTIQDHNIRDLPLLQEGAGFQTAFGTKSKFVFSEDIEHSQIPRVDISDSSSLERELKRLESP